MLPVSQRGMVQMLMRDSSPAGLEAISRRMPRRIEDALDFPVVSEVVAVAGEKEVVKYVHFELIKLASLLSVGANLTDTQASFIAEELIRVFPNETLADFKLCFQRGAIGQYNIDGEKDIFRMDGIVLRRWMEKYLEEKYQVIETRLMESKEDYHWNVPVDIDDEARRKRDLKYLDEWKKSLDNAHDTRKPRAITDNDIHREGQVTRPRQQPYKPAYTAEYLAMKDKVERAAAEFYKGRYSFDKFSIHLVEGHNVFAESLTDAQSIFQNAKAR